MLVIQLLALIVGTQMPGAWRNGVEDKIGAPVSLSSLAHLLLFAGMALVVLVRPLAWPPRRVFWCALALALLTEGLQFFAIGRHPRWLDVGIDMGGALLVTLLVRKEEVYSWLACR